VFAEHPPAQLTLLRLGFQHGNGFAESARSGKDGAPRARFVSHRYLCSAASWDTSLWRHRLIDRIPVT
jgi:hypothetical protein